MRVYIDTSKSSSSTITTPNAVDLQNEQLLTSTYRLGCLQINQGYRYINMAFLQQVDFLLIIFI